ncbi:MAG: GerAB/ArcD/ProY family transporter [Lachnospiraceae bacterium]|nr:GerAB/ArcD/ProY family transporter [Lachnospiraceae bacterium]
MFSENQKISANQLRALLLTDWMGKLLLLVTEDAGRLGGRNMLLGILAGLLLAVAAGRGAIGAAGDAAKDYYGRLDNAAGKWTAYFIYFTIMIYLVGQVSLVFYLCAQIAGTYLLPEVNETVLILVPGILGYYLARSGLEAEGRISEMTAFLLWGLFFLMLALTLPQIRPEQLTDSAGKLDGGVWKAGAYTVFAGFGTIGILPLLLPQIIVPQVEAGTGKGSGLEKGNGERIMIQKKVGEAILMGGALLLLSGAAAYGIFGTDGMKTLRWPVIVLMSCTNLQGVFLQRWDVLMIGFLIFCLFLSAGTSIYCLGAAGGRLRASRKTVLMIGVGISWLLAFWMGKSPEAVLWYRRIVFWFCAPVLAAAAVLLARREKGTGNSGNKNAE